VADIAQASLDHFSKTYRKNGKATSYVHNCRSALQRLIDEMGSLDANDLTPPGLARLRDEWDRQALVARETINLWVGTIRSAWSWAAEQGMVHPDVALRLTTVRLLQRGRSKSGEYDDVKPVAWATVERTLVECSEVVGRIVRTLWHTGMRPDEACSLRPADLDTTGDIWLYTPQSHKTAHRGRERIIAIGPQARAEIEPWLTPEAQQPIFRPALADRARGKKRDRYDAASLRRSIHRACDRAFPPPAELTQIYVRSQGRKRWRLETQQEWRNRLGTQKAAKLDQWIAEHRWNPGQLRHAKATELRKRYGIEAARLALGHADAGITHVYAERDLDRMIEIAREAG
jgi:integrase